MPSISSVNALILLRRFEQSTKFSYFSVRVLLSYAVFLLIFSLHMALSLLQQIVKVKAFFDTILAQQSINCSGRLHPHILLQYPIVLIILIVLRFIGRCQHALNGLQPPKVYNLIMENNPDRQPAPPASQEHPQSQSKKKSLGQFDEELNEGKHVLDQLHQEYNERYQNMHKELESQRERFRNSHERGQNSPQEGFEKIESRRMEGYLENDPEKDQSIDVSRNMSKKTSKIFQGCNCLKSKCSKNYCECFTQGKRCNEQCKCMGCENHSENELRLRANLQGQIGERACYCKKSNCLKKYCECYNNGAKCNSSCKCEQCKNTEDNMQNERSNTIRMQAEEVKAEPRRERSQQQVEEINNKIDEIARVTPTEYQELMFNFLEYWLS